MLDPKQQDNAIAAQEGVGGAGRRRQADGAKQRAGWTQQLRPGQRHDLRRDHQRQDEEETLHLAQWHVGRGHEKGKGCADGQGQDGAEQRRIDSVEDGALRGAPRQPSGE
jgi:hypothetical protein